jgi:hypothetical protein
MHPDDILLANNGGVGIGYLYRMIVAQPQRLFHLYRPDPIEWEREQTPLAPPRAGEADSAQRREPVDNTIVVIVTQ